MTDCSGAGTVVAGIIAAQPRPPAVTEVTGLAPDARVLPIVVGESPLQEAPTTTAGDLVKAFAAAVKAEVDVICVTVSTNQDTPALRAAVARAVEADILVISAGVVDTKAGAAVGPTFPTAYDEVLGVVGVDDKDVPVGGADKGMYIDIASPSTNLRNTGPVGDTPRKLAHSVLHQHPTAGAAYVAATAALVRQAYPKATWEEVARRIVLTADPVSGDVTPGVW